MMRAAYPASARYRAPLPHRAVAVCMLGIALCAALLPGGVAVAAGKTAPQAVPQATELPLTDGPAWSLADQAYKAYGAKDYAQAQAYAEQALALRPDVTKLWLLLVYALQNQQQPRAAIEVADRAIAEGHGSPELLRARATLAGAAKPARAAAVPTTRTPSWRLADQAYKAYDHGDYATAEARARASLALTPRQPGVQALLVYALEKQNKTEAAAQEADKALAATGSRAKPADPALLALRDRMHRRLAPQPALASWAAYQRADYATAAPLARQAVEQAPDVAAYRYLLAGSLIASGDFQAADAAATQALDQDAEDASSLVLRGYARQQLGRNDAAQADFQRALQQDWLSEYQLTSLKQIVASAQQPRQANRQAASSPPQLTCTSDETDIVCAVVPEGGGLGTGPGYQAASAAYADYARRDYRAAANHARVAVQAEPGNVAYRLLLVNALAQSGQRAQAREEIQPLLEAESLPANTLLDAAYAAQRLSLPDQASKWFKQALAASDAGGITLEPQARYNVRRAVSDLDRTWGYVAALGYGTVGYENSSSPPSLSKRRTLQQSQEVYWRPPVVGMRGGTGVELYARASSALYDGTGGSTGNDTLQGALGVRWKPFSQQNVILAAERFVPLGRDSRSDWLLRAAWSDGEGGDLRAGQRDWRYWQVYAEGDYFIERPQKLASFEARYGRSYRAGPIDSRFTVTPFAALAGNYDTDYAQRSTLGVGPGVALRYWFREDATHAPRSFVDFNVQYRLRIAGADRSNGIFAGLYFSY
jgi:tetratricopeptide (TPR) repeat protein